MSPASMNETTGLRHYLDTLRRGAVLIVVVTVAVTAAAVLQTLRQEKLYQSAVNVFLDPRAVNSSIGAIQGSGDPERVLDTQAATAQIPEIADRAVRIAGVPDRNPGQFLANASVHPATNADILTFSVRDKDPVAARKLTVAYAQSYRQYRREQETAALRRARQSVQDDIKQARAKVKEEGAISSTTLERLENTDRQLEDREQEVALGTTVALGRLPAGAVQIQPHPQRNAMLGAILGLLLGLGIVFLRDTLNTRVRTAADVEERLGMPLLGRLDQPPKQLRTSDRLLMMEMPTAPSAEAFRLLATNIEFTNLDRGARSLMITSANRAEGKSTTIANLAVALARSGRRIILIDLDLRRPIVSKFFQLENPIGVTEVALGRSTLDEALVKIPLEMPLAVSPGTVATNGHSSTPPPDPSWAAQEQRAMSAIVMAQRGQQAQGQGSLEVLAAGPLPPNPAEFLRSQAMSHVLNEAVDRADMVLVDAPPILQVSDAAVITPKVDAVVIATLMQVVRRGTLDELRRVLDKAPITKLGFVVTGASAEEGFAGRDGYGYGLGYGPDEEKKKRRSLLSR